MDLPDYWLARPGPEPDADLRAIFDAIWTAAVGREAAALIDEVPAGQVWQFVCHLADVHGLALHGSGSPDIELFEPRQPHDLTEFGNQKAVYAAGDGIWAMFFAIVDRARIESIANVCIRLGAPGPPLGPPHYVFAVSESALPSQPWRAGYVYVLPSASFIEQPPMRLGNVEAHIPHLASFEPVRPLARVRVSPGDFPFLAQIRGIDDARLSEYAAAMQTGGPWPDPANLD